MIYRKEIDGLRAIAVIPVILFHAGFGLFSGGFLGVDVFFVISGYLITSILVEDKRNKRFSFLRFYERRARRILPPLLAMMLGCVPFALWLMLPDDLENFGQSLLATSLFSNNILLWFTSDYFQLEAEFKPLLHTWTLAVEEQYYIIYPALIALLWSARTRGLAIVLFLLALASLILAEWGWRNMPEANFYLLPTRGWELLTGGLAGLYLLRGKQGGTVNQWLSLAGLVLVLYGFFAFDLATPTPSLYTAVPVFGTTLVILFATPGTLTNRILSSPALVGIGLISYSLYLWHQPILAFMRLTRMQEPGLVEVALCLGVTVILSLLSYKYIETPFREPTRINRKTLILTCSIASALLIALGLYFHLSSGMVRNWPELADDQGNNQLSAGLNKAYNKSAQRFYAEQFPDNGKKNILVLGDSFARDFINMGLENNYFNGKNLVYNYGHICQFDEKMSGDETNPGLIHTAHAIVFAGRFSSAATDCIPSLDAYLTQLSQHSQVRGTQVLVIGQKNFGWNNNAVMRIHPDERYTLHVAMLEDVSEANSAIQDTLSRVRGINFVSVMSTVMDEVGKVPVFTPGRKFISQDRQHLTRAGAQYIGRELLVTPEIQALVKR